MAYTTIPKSSAHFNAKLYTGTGSSNAVTGIGFSPSFTWLKNRVTTNHHTLFDAVRGANKVIYSNLNAQQYTVTQELKSFDSDGFTVGTESSANGNGNGIVSWNWKANGSGSSNTDGTISSTVSANTTSGFSIVKYTGTQATATVGHGLGIAPKMIFFKNVDVADEWLAGVDSGSIDFTKYAYLNLTNLFSGNGAAFFNDTNPTSSVFSLGNSSNINKTGSAIIAYCFADVPGFSKINSYIGNGNADGTFIYTGFKPAFVMTKIATGSANAWIMFDNKRPNYNGNSGRLEADSSGAETSSTGEYAVDLLSNGFKFRGTGGGTNSSGQTYLYMAFAENPFVSNVGESIPTTAR